MSLISHVFKVAYWDGIVQGLFQMTLSNFVLFYAYTCSNG